MSRVAGLTERRASDAAVRCHVLIGRPTEKYFRKYLRSMMTQA